MENKIRIAIVGYGNLGQGVESAVSHSPDMELVGIFSRRSPEKMLETSPQIVKKINDKVVTCVTETPVFPYKDLINEDLIEIKNSEIDVAILCGGSATDLPEMSPELAKYYNVVDSFDTHANTLAHLSNVDVSASPARKSAIISAGWDPGLFSLARLYANAALPQGSDYTFWGRGISQGHSDAIRRIEGVVDARQYTVPVEDALNRVRSGENPSLTTREKHLRECYVVAEEGADLARIEEEIVTMPNYFDEYDTTVTFISLDELMANHSGMPHGGSVIRSGSTGHNNEFSNTIEFSLALNSNPYFTGSILTACARAAYRLNQNGDFGCKTIFDIPPVLLMPDKREDIISHFL